MRIIVFMNVPHWEGEGCQDSSCSLLSLPSRPVRACSVSRRWQQCVSLAEMQPIIHTHTQNSTQCPLSSSTGNEHNAVSVLRHPSLPSRECCAPAPALYHWPAWGLGSHSCSPVLWPLVRALSPRELLKPSSHSNSLSLAIYQPMSWPVASGVCFFEKQSYKICLATLFGSNVVLWCLVGI